MGCPIRKKLTSAQRKCLINEAKNKLGSNRCTKSSECAGKRVCSSAGWCSGNSGCPIKRKLTAAQRKCLINEAKNKLGSNRCTKSSECAGKRVCSSAGWCSGNSGCPRKLFSDDTTELRRRMTCKSVAKRWAKWVKSIKRHPRYLKATKKQRRKFWGKVFKWAIKFDAKHRCGWVKVWKKYCNSAHKKFARWIKKIRKHPKYLKATKKQRFLFWKRVAKKVLKWNRSKRCHMVSKKWRNIKKLARKLRGH